MKLNLPKGWHQVTIRQLAEAYSVEIDTELNEIEKISMWLSIYSGANIIDIDKRPLKDNLTDYRSMTFLGQQPSNKFVNSFNIDGKTYRVNPDITKLTTAQFMAIDYFTKDGKAKENLHNLMAIFALEDGEVYDMTKSSAKAQLFYEKLTINIVNPVSDFFFNLLIQSLGNIQHSLDEQMTEAIRTNLNLIQELQD